MCDISLATSFSFGGYFHGWFPPYPFTFNLLVPLDLKWGVCTWHLVGSRFLNLLGQGLSFNWRIYPFIFTVIPDKDFLLPNFYLIFIRYASFLLFRFLLTSLLLHLTAFFFFPSVLFWFLSHFLSCIFQVIFLVVTLGVTIKILNLQQSSLNKYQSSFMVYRPLLFYSSVPSLLYVVILRNCIFMGCVPFNINIAFIFIF